MRIARLTCAVQQSSTAGPLSLVAFDGNGWSGPEVVAGSSLEWPPALVRFQEALWCLHQDSGMTGQLMAASSADGEHWGADAVVVRNAMSASPAALVVEGTLYVFFQNYGTNGALACATTKDGVTWTGPTTAPVSTRLVLSPAVALFRRAIYVIYGGGTNRTLDGTLRYVTLSGPSWSTWSSEALIPTGVATVTMPTAAVYEGRLFVIFEEGIPQQMRCWCLLEGGTWEAGPPMPLVPMQLVPGRATAAVFEGLLYVLWRTATGTLGYTTFDGEAWRPAAQVGSFKIAREPAATVF